MWFPCRPSAESPGVLSPPDSAGFCIEVIRFFKTSEYLTAQDILPTLVSKELFDTLKLKKPSASVTENPITER